MAGAHTLEMTTFLHLTSVGGLMMWACVARF
jgi:hypothetical protein